MNDMKKIICKQTGKECEYNCISNNGGYAGDDCYIVHQKYSNELNFIITFLDKFYSFIFLK